MLSSRFLQRNGNGTRDLSLARELLLSIQAAGVPTYRQTIPAIAAELRRCRRYERPLTVLAVSLGAANVPLTGETGANGVDPAAAQVALHSGVDCLVFLLLGTLLRDVTRESDLVTYAAEEHVYALFLAEASGEAAVKAARRLARALHERAGVRIRAGIAEFPGHGLTVDALFDHAISVLGESEPVSLEVAAEGAEESEWQNLRSAR
jgi:hypothetical protein